MITRWIRKYFSIVFILATLLGVMHHHDTLQVHNDCQICIVQSNIVDGDIPTPSLCFADLDIKSEALITEFQNLYNHKKFQKFHSRAPPKIS
jgi:hypothetical protein